MSTTLRRSPIVPALGLALSLLGGCAFATPSEPAPATTEVAKQPPATVAATDQGTPVAPPETGAPATSRTITHEGDRFALDVYPLHREGPPVTMNVRLRAVDIATENADHRAILATTSDITSAANGLPNGFSLVDAKAKMIYFPAEEGDRPLCSPELPLFWVTGDEVWISCIFGAPPAGTNNVTLRAASFGSFTHVPIQ